MVTIEINGKRAFIFKPYPDYWIAIKDTTYHFNTIDDIRNSKIDSELKEEIIRRVK
jgi:hypothetical protein